MADEPPPAAAAAAAAAAPAAAAASDVVGFAYQPDMLLHRGPRNHHPEKPERLTAVLEVLQAGGLPDQRAATRAIGHRRGASPRTPPST